MTLVHEFQHLIQRHLDYVYSPLILIEKPDVLQFCVENNKGIPLEAGHLFWAMLTGTIGLKSTDLIALTDNQAENPGFWKELSKNIPIVDIKVIKEIEFDDFIDLPFSFEARKFLSLVW